MSKGLNLRNPVHYFDSNGTENSSYVTKMD
jgi:hypothetical protein